MKRTEVGGFGDHVVLNVTHSVCKAEEPKKDGRGNQGREGKEEEMARMWRRCVRVREWDIE